MPKFTVTDNYYKGIEVQKMLGITEPALRNLVNQGKIRKITPPGRKNGVYLKSEIDAFAIQWEAFLLAKEPPQLTFGIAKAEDMEAENELDRRTVGGAGMTAEIRRAWYNVCPNLDYNVKYGDRLVAFMRLIPVKPTTLNSFMDGKIRAKDIPPQDIETLEPGKPIECLVSGIASDPDVTETMREHYVLKLIRGILQELETLGENGIIIKAIYATSESPTGIATAIHIGMETLDGRLGKRIRFILDIDKIRKTEKKPYKSMFMRSYIAGLEKWEARQENLR